MSELINERGSATYVEEYNYGVTRILSIENNNPESQATGFFYKNIERENALYLITNRHVAIEEREDFYPDCLEIEIHSSAEIPRQVRVVKIPLYDEKHRPIWLEYPRLEEMYVDIIAINLQNYCQDGDQYYYWDKNDYPSQSQIISQGHLIRVIGYPEGIHDYIHKLPIARHATIASPYTVAFDNWPNFLIDVNLHPGLSGSPVIIPNSGTRPGKEKLKIHSLLGVLSAGDTDLELGIVWYPGLIQELIENNMRGVLRTLIDDINKMYRSRVTF
jgi:hypothetical protein